MRIILLGNAGAGKTTMARKLMGDHSSLARLSLDEIAWNEGVQRKPLPDSLAALRQFIESYPDWIIEGCYGDLVEEALPYCSELRFLNPSVEACVNHCLRRSWEPEKFPTAADQQAALENLIKWVKTYPERDDEYGLKRHRQIFDYFPGPKQEYTDSDFHHSPPGNG